MISPCERPLSFETLVAYERGELEEEASSSVEEHYFACDACARRLETVALLAAGVEGAVAEGRVTASVTRDWIERGTAGGLRIRSYELAPGEQVACTAAPTDDFVAIHLGVVLDEAPRSVDVRVEWTDLGSGLEEERWIEDLTFDPQAQRVILLFAGDQVREFPESQWRMRAVVRHDAGERSLGPYTLNHTPWERLGERP